MSTLIEPLDRYLIAQDRDYEQALRELREGRKQTHWMWYVFPQLRGLGQSAISHEYGIDGRQEALAYVSHSVLGYRLRECVNAMLSHRGAPAEEVLGDIDALKLCSCLTLFMEVAPAEPCFKAALTEFYGGQPDMRTLQLLSKAAN